MQPIESKSLRERVINRLRTAIMNGELKPGQPLVGSELATQLGVSNATMRDAIYTLSIEGLVETVAYHVPTVKKLSRKDIEDLFSVRSMLEAFAIKQIISANHVSTAVKELRDICDEMAEAAENDSLGDVNWRDRQFHDALIKHSGNQLLAILWNTVAQRVQQVMSLRNKKKGDLPQIARNHLAIAAIIEDQDTDEAVRLIIAHIGSVADVVAGGWSEDEE